ncbi:MAG: hypothetical protein HC874_14095 [Richelia sp. SL_2_1]|nr:hypothetical protein [Richelia sp. SL_2_1]
MKPQSKHKVSREIEVNGITSELSVNLVVNQIDGTYKITTQLTTKQVHPNNDAIVAATLKQLSEMITEMVAEAKRLRAEILGQNSETDNGLFDVEE